MKTIKYEVQEISTTYCEKEFNMVGSAACIMCEYFKDINVKKHMVKCDYPKE